MGRTHDSTPLICRHTHFTYEERLRLEYYLKGKGRYPKIQSHQVLGRLLGKHPRTISREIKRGQVLHALGELPFEAWRYNADHAQLEARSKDSGKGPRYKLGHDWALSRELGRLIGKAGHSPYAALRRLDDEGWPTDTRICEKTLYTYLYEGLVEGAGVQDLLYKGRRRKPKVAARRHRRACAAQRSITTRPVEAQDRAEAGHWEGDTIVSGTGKGSHCLLTLTERTSRAEVVLRLEGRRSECVVRALDALERTLGSPSFRALFRTVTFDNGCEFQDAQAMERSVLCKGGRTRVFYAHPYTASERGTNENHNGIVRRSVPKGAAIGDYPRTEAKRIQHWMNGYPRRILGGRTPFMLLQEYFPTFPKILSFFDPVPKEVC